MSKLYILLFFLATTVAQAQWTTSTISQARSNFPGTANGNKIFFGGGWTGSVESSVVDIYDTNTQTWSTSALSVAREALTATSVGTKVFFAGGYTAGASNTVDIYNTSTSSWTTATLTVARYYLSAASVGTKVFFAGGYNGTSNYNTVDIYDNSSNTWSTTTLSQARSSLAAASAGSKVLFAGGYGTNYSNVVDIYDNSTNTWTTATLSQARESLTATSLGSKVFFAGGSIAGSLYSNVVDIYDVTTNTWTTATLSQGRQLLAATAVGSKVIFAGGDYGAGSSNFSNVVDIYDISTNTWSTSTLPQTKSFLTAASAGAKALFAGGYNGSQLNSVDIYTAVPTVGSFSPNSGTVGTTVTISGINFSTTPANNIVKFNGTTATATASTTSSITTTVPSGATTGTISVTVGGQTGTSVSSFTVTSAPSITSFTPTSGTVGTSVTISGTNFSATAANNTVKFNGTTATVTSSTTTSISTTVPAGATTGTITVTVGGLTGTSASNFTVTTSGSPTITSFSPTTGPVGTSVTISGTNFNATPANNTVKFNGTTATVTLSSATSITTSVPSGATTGTITVTVGGLTGTSSTNFTVGSATTAPKILSSSLPASFDNASSLTASITVDDASKVNKVVFYYIGISDPASNTLSNYQQFVVAPSGSTFSATIPAASLNDAIGELYDFKIYSFVDTVWANSTDWNQAYKHYPKTSSPSFSNLSFGNQVSNYQIVSVPLNLKNKAVTDVFSALGGYVKSNWRLFQYANGSNSEYPAFNTIDAGKGYWLIVRNSANINPGEGTTLQLDSNYDYTIDLNPGWNLIGNPFNFRVSWNAVLTNSGSPTNIGNLKVFKNGTLSENDILEPYRGGFVNNGTNSKVTVRVSCIKDATLGGREAANFEVRNSLDQPEWQVKLVMSNGELSNQLNGIGMSPTASVVGKDPQDEVCVPLPEGLDLFELRYAHPELKEFFSKEVVPTQSNFKWDFDVVNRFENVELSWDNSYFGSNDRQLFLFDPVSMQVVDMKAVNRLSLSTGTKKLQVLYGDMSYIQRNLENELSLLGAPYPNPSRAEATIPFRVPESLSDQLVKINVYNDIGACVGTPINQNMKDGLYETKWGGRPGIYFVRMSIGNNQSSTMKLIIY